MNQEMIIPKNKTEDLKLSIPKICETRSKQTRTKQQETLEFRLIKARESFLFKGSNVLGHDSKMMLV